MAIRLIDFWEEGLCREYDMDLFFIPEGLRGTPRRKRVREAKAICHQCPVMAKCARYALEAREPYGVWGGLSEKDRDEILERQRRRLTSTTKPAHRASDQHQEVR